MILLFVELFDASPPLMRPGSCVIVVFVLPPRIWYQPSPGANPFFQETLYPVIAQQAEEGHSGGQVNIVGFGPLSAVRDNGTTSFVSTEELSCTDCGDSGFREFSFIMACEKPGENLGGRSKGSAWNSSKEVG